MGGASQSRERPAEAVGGVVAIRQVWTPPPILPLPLPSPPLPGPRSKTRQTSWRPAGGGGRKGGTGDWGSGGGGLAARSGRLCSRGAVPSTRLTDGGRMLGAGGRPLLVKVVVQVPSCRREQSRGHTDGQALQGHRESRVE